MSQLVMTHKHSMMAAAVKVPDAFHRAIVLAYQHNRQSPVIQQNNENN